MFTLVYLVLFCVLYINAIEKTNVPNAILRILNEKRRTLTNPNVLTNSEKQQLLDAHNSERSLTAQGMTIGNDGLSMPSSSNMNRLLWDQSLEAVASDYASQCIFAHNPSSATDLQSYSNIASFDFPTNGIAHVGENLYVHSASPSTTDVVMRSTVWWYNEAQYWKYGLLGDEWNWASSTDDCTDGEQCGHFTQGVWANTRYVGCAFYHCSSGMDPSQYSVFHTNVICNYYPSGNWLGQVPYKSGNVCTDCNSDRTCDSDGLCGGGVCESYLNDNDCSDVDVCDDGLGRNICDLTTQPCDDECDAFGIRLLNETKNESENEICFLYEIYRRSDNGICADLVADFAVIGTCEIDRIGLCEKDDLGSIIKSISSPYSVSPYARVRAKDNGIFGYKIDGIQMEYQPIQFTLCLDNVFQSDSLFSNSVGFMINDQRKQCKQLDDNYGLPCLSSDFCQSPTPAPTVFQDNAEICDDLCDAFRVKHVLTELDESQSQICFSYQIQRRNDDNICAFEASYAAIGLCESNRKNDNCNKDDLDSLIVSISSEDDPSIAVVSYERNRNNNNKGLLGFKIKTVIDYKPIKFTLCLDNQFQSNSSLSNTVGFKIDGTKKQCKSLNDNQGLPCLKQSYCDQNGNNAALANNNNHIHSSANHHTKNKRQNVYTKWKLVIIGASISVLVVISLIVITCVCIRGKKKDQIKVNEESDDDDPVITTNHNTIINELVVLD